MDEQRRERRQQAVETIVGRSGLAGRLGNKVLRAAGGLGDLAGSDRTQAFEAMTSAVRRRIVRELCEVFDDDEALVEAAVWFESRASSLFREVEERLADAASPLTLLEDALADPRMPERYRELQRLRPVVFLDQRRGKRRPPRG